MANDLLNAINLEVKDGEKCAKQVLVTIDQDTVKKEADKATRNVANYVSIPGFRKGKAPISVIKSRYADSIKEELERQLVSAAYTKVSQDESMDILSCNLDGEVAIELDKAVSFAFKVAVAPEIDLGDYKNIKVEVEKKEVTDKEVDERIAMYRTMYSNYNDVDGAAEMEDMLKVSYTSDFVAPEDASAFVKRQAEASENYLWLKEPEMIPGANKCLVGAKAGDEVKFTAEYPADYREAALASKTINYDLKVLAVQRRSELTDEELVAKLQAPSFEEFKNTIKSALERDIEDANNAKVLDAVGTELDKIVKDFELPEAFLAGETNRELRKLADSLVKSEADGEEFTKNIEDHKKTAEENAKKALRRSLIIRKLAKIEKITVSEEEINQQISVMASYYGYKAKELRSLMEKNGSIDEVYFNMLSAKTLQFIADNMNK